MHAAPASGFPWTLQLDKWARSATATCNLGRTRVGLRRVSPFAVTSHLPAALIVNFVTEPLCCALVGLHLYISSLKLSKCSRLQTFFHNKIYNSFLFSRTYLHICFTIDQIYYIVYLTHGFTYVTYFCCRSGQAKKSQVVGLKPFNCKMI